VHGLNVAVVGGGIGGLTAAVALARAGHEPTVYERTSQLQAVGAGISVWSNGIKVLNLLGLGAQVAALGGTMERMVYAAADGAPLTGFSLTPLYDQVGERAWPVARADLQELLVEAVGDRVRTGARCVGVEDGPRAALVRFEDGSEVEADLVVGADGTHSGLRTHVLGGAVPRRYVGYVNWNGIVNADAEIVEPCTWKTWVGGGRRASVMPIGGDRLYFFFDVPVDASGLDGLGSAPELLRREFGQWAAPVRRLLDRLPTVAVNAVAIHDLEPLPTWSRGRVVLLGDAAHSMAPDLGQGGCQAMEDAWVLTHYLTSTNRSISDALARYEAERRPHTADIVRRARNRAEITHGVDPAATEAWYEELAREDGSGIIAGLARSVLTGPCR
jgi:FAD-dependent urate hydroxylase